MKNHTYVTQKSQKQKIKANYILPITVVIYRLRYVTTWKNPYVTQESQKQIIKANYILPITVVPHQQKRTHNQHLCAHHHIECTQSPEYGTHLRVILRVVKNADAEVGEQTAGVIYIYIEDIEPCMRFYFYFCFSGFRKETILRLLFLFYIYCRTVYLLVMCEYYVLIYMCVYIIYI